MPDRGRNDGLVDPDGEAAEQADVDPHPADAIAETSGWAAARSGGLVGLDGPGGARGTVWVMSTGSRLPFLLLSIRAEEEAAEDEYAAMRRFAGLDEASLV